MSLESREHEIREMGQAGSNLVVTSSDDSRVRFDMLRPSDDSIHNEISDQMCEQLIADFNRSLQELTGQPIDEREDAEEIIRMR